MRYKASVSNENISFRLDIQTFLIIGRKRIRKVERKFFCEAAFDLDTLSRTNTFKKKRKTQRRDECVLFPLERLKTVYVRIDDRSERREEKKL